MPLDVFTMPDDAPKLAQVIFQHEMEDPAKHDLFMKVMAGKNPKLIFIHA